LLGGLTRQQMDRLQLWIGRSQSMGCTRGGAEQMTFTGHKSVVEALAFSPPDGHLLATGSQDGTVRLVDMDKSKETGILGGY
jgi:WD40 repeat protein